MTLKEKYGEWALITGASSGIGEEFACFLAAQGLNLILVSRRKERLEKLSHELKKKNRIEIVIAPVDLKNENFINKLKELTGDKEVGMLINNAGFGSKGEFADFDSLQDVDMVKVNCIAPTILTHHFVRPMIQRKKGAIIFLGSILACQPTPFMTTYSATKVFNAYMGDALWYELKKYNIDVLTLNPGSTSTEFHKIANAATGPSLRTAKQVVITAMKSLGKKPSVIDGFMNKLLGVSSHFCSRKNVVTISGWITKKLYSGKNQSS